MGNDLIVKTGEELDALLSLRASSQYRVGSSNALNGIPEEYHHRMYWLREMGIEDSAVGKRMLRKYGDIGVSLALKDSPVLERVLMSAENPRVKSD